MFVDWVGDSAAERGTPGHCQKARSLWKSEHSTLSSCCAVILVLFVRFVFHKPYVHLQKSWVAMVSWHKLLTLHETLLSRLVVAVFRVLSWGQHPHYSPVRQSLPGVGLGCWWWLQECTRSFSLSGIKPINSEWLSWRYPAVSVCCMTFLHSWNTEKHMGKHEKETKADIQKQS